MENSDTSTGLEVKGSFTRVVAYKLQVFISAYAILPAIILLGLVLSITSKNFLTINNIVNVLRQVSMVAIIAVGAYFIIVSGGLDLSLGAVVGFTSVVLATLIVKMGVNPYFAIIITIGLGALCGAINGFTVTRLSIPPLIATMGLQMVLVGVSYIICQGYTIANIPREILGIGRGYAFGIPWIPVPVLLMLLIAIMADFISQRTKFGRYLYAIGGNQEAAHLSGIRYKTMQSLSYVIAGALASLSGIIVTGRLASGNAASGGGWEFSAIIGCVIGGVSTTGGRGRVFGAILGTLMIGLLNNGMTLLNINSYYQQVVSGLVLMTSIAFDIYSSKQKKIRKEIV
jgi:ribose transport system permease protein